MPRHRHEPAPLDPAAEDATEYAARLVLSRRLKEIIGERHLSASALAAQAGISLSILNDIIAAKRSPTLRTLARIAHAVDLPLADLHGNVTYPPLRQAATTIPIRGSAYLGVWKSMALRDEPRGMAADVEPIDERYRDFTRCGIEVTDDSMMGLSPPVPRGAVAVYAEIAGADIAIEPGRVYLIHRKDREGRIESAFWRVTAYRDRYELVPLTTDPERNRAETVVVTRAEMEAGETVVIGGKYVGFSYASRD